MRRPRRDERWDRTPGGLIVPRRVGLPTRRFIGWMGIAQDCCEVEETCDPCAEGEGFNPSAQSGVWANFTLADVPTCTSCNEFNDSYWLPLVYVGPWDCPVGYGPACAAMFGDEFDVSLCGYGPPLYIWAHFNTNPMGHGVYVSTDQLFKCGPSVVGRGFSGGCNAISGIITGRCTGSVTVTV